MVTILLVEDNPDNCDLIEAFLADDYDLEICHDGFSALEYLESDSPFPHLFLFDISLPQMDGVELLRRVRQLGTASHIPAIAVTSHAMKGDQERFIHAGFQGYVSKPIDEEKLLQALGDIIG